MDDGLSSKDFAIRRLATTCRLLKNWEDIAAKYANVEDDDIIDLTDLTIHRDRGRLSRSNVPDFGFSHIRFTRKTLPDQEIHHKFGDCLEEEFPGVLGEENDCYEAKSVAGVSMISNKTVIEVMEEKMNLLRLNPSVKNEETSDIETLSSSDIEDEFEITNPKSMMGLKKLKPIHRSSNDGGKRNGMRHSSRDRAALNADRNNCKAYGGTLRHGGTLRKQKNQLSRRVSGRTAQTSLKRHGRESDSWESESLDSDGSGECSKAETDAILHGTPVRNHRRRGQEQSKSTSLQMGSHVRRNEKENGAINRKRSETTNKITDHEYSYDSVNVLPCSEASDMTVDSGVVRDYGEKPSSDRIDDDVIIDNDDVILVDDSSSDGEEVLLLSCDEDSFKENTGVLKTPEKDLDATYTIISPNYNQQAVNMPTKSSSKSTYPMVRQPEMNEQRRYNTSNRLPRRIQPTLIGNDHPSALMKRSTHKTICSPLKIKNEVVSPMKNNAGSLTFNTANAGDLRCDRSSDGLNRQQISGNLNYHSNPHSNNVRNQCHESARIPHDGDVIEIRPFEEDGAEAEEVSYNSPSPVRYSVRDPKWSGNNMPHSSSNRGRHRDDVNDYRQTRGHVRPSAFHHQGPSNTHYSRFAQDLGNEMRVNEMQCSPGHRQDARNCFSKELDCLCEVGGDCQDCRVFQTVDGDLYMTGESECFQPQQAWPYELPQDLPQEYHDETYLHDDYHDRKIMQTMAYHDARPTCSTNGCSRRTKTFCPSKDKHSPRHDACSRPQWLDQRHDGRQQMTQQSQPQILKQGMCVKNEVPLQSNASRHQYNCRRRSRDKENLPELLNVNYGNERLLEVHVDAHKSNQRFKSNRGGLLWKSAPEYVRNNTHSPAKRKRSMDSESEMSFSNSDGGNTSGFLDVSDPTVQDRLCNNQNSHLDCTESQIETIVAQNFNQTHNNFTRKEVNRGCFSHQFVDPNHRNIQPTRPSPRTTRGRQISHPECKNQFLRNSCSEHRHQRAEETLDALQQSPRNQGLRQSQYDQDPLVRNAGMVAESERVLSCAAVLQNTEKDTNQGMEIHRASRNDNRRNQVANSPRLTEQPEFVFDQNQSTPTSRRLRGRNVSKSPRLTENSSPLLSYPKDRRGSPRTPTSGLCALSLNDGQPVAIHHSAETLSSNTAGQRRTSPRDSAKSNPQGSPRPKPVLKFLRQKLKESPLCSPSPDKGSHKTAQGILNGHRQSSSGQSRSFNKDLGPGRSAERGASAKQCEGQGSMTPRSMNPGSMAPRSLTKKQGRLTSSRSLDFRNQVMSTPLKAVGNTPSFEIDLSTIRAGTTVHGKENASLDLESATQRNSPTVVLRKVSQLSDVRSPSSAMATAQPITHLQNYADCDPRQNTNAPSQGHWPVVVDKVNTWLEDIHYTTDLGQGGGAETSQMLNSSYNYHHHHEFSSRSSIHGKLDSAGKGSVSSLRSLRGNTSKIDTSMKFYEDYDENSTSDDSDLVVM